MSVPAGTTIVLTCKTCRDEFPHVVKSQGRYPNYCEAHRPHPEACRRYRQTEKGKATIKRQIQRAKEKYDPWLWENTILEWNE